MSNRLLRRSRWLRGLPILLACLLVLIGAPLPASAVVHEQIQGSGSSWAYNAVQQWITDVTQQGLKVVFTPTGSAQGRQDFANGVTDFAVSDIGYQGHNPITGGTDSSNRGYAYLPIVAGGTSFPYHIVVGGQRVQNLRLSGLTLAKIFTNQITNWNDPEITSDNNGRALPSIPIIPVVHSEGAGSTYQFTDWLFTENPSLWESFTKSATGQTYNFPTEYWPTGAGSQVSENGSDGVMNFVASGAGQGSIGYDEYSYAIFAGFPAAAIENAAGYFNLPDAYNVAVSLTQAQINYDKSSPNYLLETLNNVYTYNDPRTYPLSSYSYLIEPTSSGDPSVSTTAKAQTLADYVNYSICQGQAEMSKIGYSPLPINLVQASYQQVDLLHQANPAVDISQEAVANCHNPTFIPGQPNNNYLAQIAPFPPPCAKRGQGPCSGQYAHNGNPTNGQAGGGNPAAATTAAGHTATGGSASGATAASNSSATGSSATAAAASSGEDSADSTSAAAAQAVANPTELAADHAPVGLGTIAAEAAAAALLVIALAIPPYLSRRRKRS